MQLVFGLQYGTDACLLFVVLQRAANCCMFGPTKDDSRSSQIQLYSMVLRFAHTMFKGEQSQEDDMSKIQRGTHVCQCAQSKAKQGLSSLIALETQQLKCNIQIDASMYSNHSLHSKKTKSPKFDLCSNPNHEPQYLN